MILPPLGLIHSFRFSVITEVLNAGKPVNLMEFVGDLLHILYFSCIP